MKVIKKMQNKTDDQKKILIFWVAKKSASFFYAKRISTKIIVSDLAQTKTKKKSSYPRPLPH
jgi:hypothetical protein